ncbi:unnamed protein product, partial [Ectocarpus sp. 12 AP-2014]
STVVGSDWEHGWRHRGAARCGTRATAGARRSGICPSPDATGRRHLPSGGLLHAPLELRRQMDGLGRQTA